MYVMYVCMNSIHKTKTFQELTQHTYTSSCYLLLGTYIDYTYRLEMRLSRYRSATYRKCNKSSFYSFHVFRYSMPINILVII